ncbi:MAG TPA: hypothetical protein VEL74_09300 [Thermoanaerobaculia bacterium]|nr:hypothetical protein [Thermoanaerobaculia bacterium]
MPEWSPVDLLPGLWAGALLLVLAAALRRWYDPVPAPVLAAFGAAVALLFGGVLFGGGILLPLDNLRGHVPFQGLAPAEPHGNILQGDLIELVAPSQAAVGEALGERRWPLWNPRVGAGMALISDPQAQPFQPLVLLAAPMPLERAPGVTAALRVLVALTFSFLWMRRQGLGAVPALAGAFAYGLGGFLLLWVGWPLANSAALLPLVLYALTLCGQRGLRRDAALLAGGLLALLLAGHPETILFGLALAAVFLLDQVRRRPPGTRRPLLRTAALAAVAAALAAAPVLLPVAHDVPRSMRAARVSDPAVHSSPAGGLAPRWLPIAAPNAYGNSRFIHYWGLSNTNEDAAGFIGTAALLAALLSLGARRRFPQEGTALGIAGLCLVGLALPAFVPLPDSLASRRVLLPFVLCLAYLAACALERFRQGEVRRRAVLAAAAVLAGVVVWGYVTHPDPSDPERLAVFRYGWLLWQMRFLVLGALLLALPGRGEGNRWVRTAAAGGLALLVAVELVLIHRPANPPMPRRLALPVTPPLELLRESLAEDRAGLTGLRMAALGRALPPNLASLYGLPDARVYNPMAPQAYVEVTAPITAAWWGELPEFGAPDHPLYPRLGVRYLMTEPGERLPAPWRLTLEDAGAWIWEHPRALPRLFLEGRGRGALRITRLKSAWITARVRPREGGLLDSSLYQDGGWRLLVDRRLRPGHPNGGPFVVAELPEGARRVDLVYRPRAFLLGCLLAPLGLALAAALSVPPPGRR